MIARFLCPLFSALLCMTAAAQLDNIVKIGDGCTSGFRPIFGLSGTTRPGGTLYCGIGTSIGSALFYNCPLFLGASRTRWGNLTLPYNLAALGSPSCWLQISLDVMVFNTGSPPVHTCTINIPNNKGLIGGVLYAQWIVPLNGAPWVLTTDAYAITIDP